LGWRPSTNGKVKFRKLSKIGYKRLQMVWMMNPFKQMYPIKAL